MLPRLTPAATQRPVHRLTLTRLRLTLILLQAPILLPRLTLTRLRRTLILLQAPILTSRQPTVMSLQHQLTLMLRPVILHMLPLARIPMSLLPTRTRQHLLTLTSLQFIKARLARIRTFPRFIQPTLLQRPTMHQALTVMSHLCTRPKLMFQHHTM